MDNNRPECNGILEKYFLQFQKIKIRFFGSLQKRKLSIFHQFK